VSSFPRLNLRILSPDGISIEKTDLTAVNVPLADGGWIGIKPGHAPLIAETVRGAIRFRSELGEDSIEVHPGVLEIKENMVIILTAGKVSRQADFVAKPAQMDFERLMQTLVSELQPDDHPDSKQGQNG
jgi:F0F1-type ATP synthase epsilon subunit